MPAAAIPNEEELRLDTLHALEILDTHPEERFDRLTRLARRAFDAPIATISVLDENREWIKSGEGMGKSEIPLDASMCAQVIRGDDILVIADCSRDDRFRNNPLVTGQPGIRFYAACPLRAPNGSKLGAFSIIDRKAHEFGEEDHVLLRDLARMAEQELAAVHLATVDEITLLANLRGFEAQSKDALELSRRFKKPATLIYFELDQFDEICLRHGEAECTHVLRTFAHLLHDTFRESDVLARLDGGEFAAFLPNVSGTEIEKALKRLQNAVDLYNKAGQRGYEIAFNIGKVQFDASGHAEFADLMAEANAQMQSQQDKS